MKKILLLLLLPLCLNAQDIKKNADSLLTAYNRMDLFTGNALIAKDGKVLFNKSYGMADREQNISNKLNTSFRIGSISKSFTAIIILQLQEKNLLNIDDKLSKYFPEFKDSDSIKIKDLLSNSSGIRDFIGFKNSPEWSQVKSYKELFAAVSNEPLKFSPGKEFDYSSTNFLLLCGIAEKVSGKTLKTLLSENIIKKIGLKNTGIDEITRHDETEAFGYQVSSKKFYNRVDEMNIGMLYGAGGMYSTILDLLAFDQSMYGNKLLNEESKKLLFTPNKGNYGYGWEILRDDEVLSVGHSGVIDGFKANFIRFPENKITLILLSNYNDIQSYELYKEMRHIALNKPFEMPLKHEFINILSEGLKKFEGKYAINDKMALNVQIKDNLLEVLIPGSENMLMYPESETDFYIRKNNAYGKFVTDKETNTLTLQLMKGERISNWKKL